MILISNGVVFPRSRRCGGDFPSFRDEHAFRVEFRDEIDRNPREVEALTGQAEAAHENGPLLPFARSHGSMHPRHPT